MIYLFGIPMPLWLYLMLMTLYLVSVGSCVAIILSENRNPIKSLAWVSVLIFLPVVGLVFYLFFGRSLKNRHRLTRHSKRSILRNRESRLADFRQIEISPSNKQVVKLTNELTGAPYCKANEVEIFTEGRTKFDRLKEDLKNARSKIYLQYYIFSDDELGREIADILIDKSRQGVEVKVIYDHVGSFSTRNKFFKRMRESGIEAFPYFRVTFPQLANRINWRNHRKIVVIDDSIAYIGGMNIASRYIRQADGTPWRDTHFRLRGEIVQSITESFATDWSLMHSDAIIRIPPPKPSENSSVACQLLTSGPTDSWGNVELLFMRSIANARKSIYIQTPYFLPPESLLKALEAASLSGVDVRIMIPRKSDSRLLNYATFSYVTQCLLAGIKIYLYNPGMLHAKAMIIDNDFVTAGSTNFDFRSFEHNFEANLFFYDSDVNERMKKIFFDDLKQCTKLTLSRWSTRPRLQRLAESIVRLLAPVL